MLVCLCVGFLWECVSACVCVYVHLCSGCSMCIDFLFSILFSKQQQCWWMTSDPLYRMDLAFDTAPSSKRASLKIRISIHPNNNAGSNFPKPVQQSAVTKQGDTTYPPSPWQRHIVEPYHHFLQEQWSIFAVLHHTLHVDCRS